MQLCHNTTVLDKHILCFIISVVIRGTSETLSTARCEISLIGTNHIVLQTNCTELVTKQHVWEILPLLNCYQFTFLTGL